MDALLAISHGAGQTCVVHKLRPKVVSILDMNPEASRRGQRGVAIARIVL